MFHIVKYDFTVYVQQSKYLHQLALLYFYYRAEVLNLLRMMKNSLLSLFFSHNNDLNSMALMAALFKVETDHSHVQVHTFIWDV